MPKSLFSRWKWSLGAAQPGLFPVAPEYCVGQIVDVDVDLARSRPRQKLEDVLHYRFVHDRSQGLRDHTRQREEPRPLARRQNHRFYTNTCLAVKKVFTSRRNRVGTDNPPLP